MTNAIIFLVIFVIIFVVTFFVYLKNAKSLIQYHKNSLIVDILSWISGGFVIYMAFLFLNLATPPLSYLGWLQMISGSCLLNIHLARFIVRIMTQNKEG